jgi:hypothetical protein
MSISGDSAHHVSADDELMGARPMPPQLVREPDGEDG